MTINKKQLFILHLIIFIAFVAMTLPYPIIAPLILLNAHNDSLSQSMNPGVEVSYISGAYPFGLFIGSLVIGNLADKYDKRKVLLLSLFMAAITQVINGVLVYRGLYPALLITRFLSGAFEGNIAIARAIIATSFNLENLKKKHFGRTNAALTLGWAIGPILGATVSNHNLCSFFNYSTPFYLGGIITLTTFLLVFYKFNEPIIINKIKLTDNAKRDTSFLNKKVLVFLTFSFLITIGIDAFYQFLPILLNSYSKSIFFIAIAISITALSNTLANIFLIPLLSKHINTLNCIIIFPLALSIGISVLPNINNSYVIIVLLSLIGASIACTMTNMLTFISNTSSPLIQGKLMGTLLSQRTLGTALVSFLMAPLLNFNYKLPFIIGSIIILFGLILLPILKQLGTAIRHE